MSKQRSWQVTFGQLNETGILRLDHEILRRAGHDKREGWGMKKKGKEARKSGLVSPSTGRELSEAGEVRRENNKSQQVVDVADVRTVSLLPCGPQGTRLDNYIRLASEKASFSHATHAKSQGPESRHSDFFIFITPGGM